jgi:hypothetical protein
MVVDFNISEPQNAAVIYCIFGLLVFLVLVLMVLHYVIHLYKKTVHLNDCT